jgi:hypothetical protein
MFIDNKQVNHIEKNVVQMSQAVLNMEQKQLDLFLHVLK